MKRTAIILLILSVVLSVVLSAASCGKKDPHGAEYDTETDAQTYESETEPESAGIAESDSETAPQPESETETDAEPDSSPENDAEKNTVLCNFYEFDEIYYLTSVADRSYGESGTEYTDENKVLGAVIFDRVPSRLSFNVYLPNIEDRIGGHENYYGWFDCCLYPLSEECMSGGAVSFVTRDEIYSLDGAEVFTGTTADGSSYCFYKTAGEGGAAARYYGFISLGDEHMAALMLSDDGKNDVEWENGFRPMLDSARTYVPGEDSELVYEYYIGSYDGDTAFDKYRVSCKFPDAWDTSYATGYDLPRKLDGRYSIKRFEIASMLLSPEEKDEGDLEYYGYAPEYDSEDLGKTGRGYEYEVRTEKTMSEGERNLGVTWHHTWIKVPGTTDSIYLTFVTYSDDGEGYFEKYCLPVLDSIEIEQLS
ncbi:MAG: hypothetical protein ACI4XJ_00075 [Eubacteriales bacterium]